MAGGWRCWGCCSPVLGSCGTSPALPGQGCCSQHLVLARGSSPGVFSAGCRASGPDVAPGSGVACGRVQVSWSCCCPEALGSHGMALMLPGYRCWSRCSPVLGSRGTSPALPGGGCCSQHLVLARGSSPSFFWAGCRASGPDVAPGSVVACGRAQVSWSCCCPEALGSHRMALMPPGYHCWGCCSLGLSSHGMTPILTGYQCQSQRALRCHRRL